MFEAPSEQKQLVTVREVISNVLIRKTVGIIHYCVAVVLTIVLFTLFPPPPSSPSQPYIHTQTSQSSAKHLVSFIAAVVKYTHCVFGGGGPMMQRHLFSTLHPLSLAIFATATVVAFVLLHNSRFNFHCYTHCEATRSQKSAWK